MKFKPAIQSLLTLAVVAGLGLSAAFAKDKDKEQAHLQKEAKITKAEAQKIALKKVSGGTVKEAELEREEGKLIWSFDIAHHGTENITEVNASAITGKIVSVEVETPKDRAKEAKEDEAKKKAGDKKN